MDPHEYEHALESLQCVKDSNVQYFDSRDENPNNDRLDEGQLLSKIQHLKELVRQPPPTTQSEKGVRNGPFIMISANGDHVYNEAKRALRISKKALKEFVAGGIFPPQMLSVYQLTGDHFSHHVLYDEDEDTPKAVYIMLRVPRLNNLITLMMRVDVLTHTTIALVTAVVPTTVASLRTRCMRQCTLVARNPLHLLRFMLEQRMHDLEQDVERLWGRVEELDGKTGMTPACGWVVVRGWNKETQQQDYTRLLRELHQVGTELRLLQAIARFVAGLSGRFRGLMERMERLREELGMQRSGRAARAEWEDQLAYTEDRVSMTSKKFQASIARVQDQIAVTYSLIAQKSSEQNIRIARLTAKDSQTMKTITVLTLTFLPSTMLASLWDAGIFSLPEEKSWRVYVGASFGLTVVVFALWFLYSWLVKTENAVQVVDVEGEEVQDA